MDERGIEGEDLIALEEGLRELTELYERLSIKYNLRSDLVEFTDRRYSLQHQLNSELQQLEEYKQSLANEVNNTLAIKEKLEEYLSLTAEIENIIFEDELGDSRYKAITELTSRKTIDSLKKELNEINEIYEYIIDTNNKLRFSHAELTDEISELRKYYKKYFLDKNSSGESKVEQVSTIYQNFIQCYNEWFIASNENSKNKKEIMEGFIHEIQSFHEKVYGNDTKEIPSLKEELDERLKNLENVESRAKSMINLSSDAGLAGGFVQKAKEAKKGQMISVLIFIVSIICIFGFNFFMFDKEDFLNMSWDSFIFKLLINAPLVWAATIANINLNKFSRLEQEYSHKEALAKSYERYKTEIQELKMLGHTDESVDQLRIKLLDINLDAFKVNPAKYSDSKGKDSVPLDSVLNKEE